MGHGWCALPNREFVHHAYSQVLRMEIVVQGLQMLVTVLRLCIAWLIDRCSRSVVKSRCIFLWSICGSCRL